MHAKPDATVTLSRMSLNDIILGQATFDDKIAAGEVRITGDQAAVVEFVGLLDGFELWFNIVTP